MPTPRFVGSRKATTTALSFGYDPRLGYKPGSTLRGPLGTMLGQSILLVGLRIAHRFQQEGPEAEIVIEGGSTIDSGQNEVPVDEWQLQTGEQQRDILQAPAAIAMEAAAPGILGATVFDVQRANQNLPSIMNNGQQPPNGFTVPGGLQTQQIQLGHLLLTGETHYPVDAPVLRHTQTISDSYTGGGINRTNQRAVYTTAQLLAECATFPYPLPQVMIDSVNAVQASAEAAPAGYLVGWWKRITGQNTAANYKVQIVTEYLFGRYNTFVFTAAQ